MTGFLRALARELERATDAEQEELWRRLNQALTQRQSTPVKGTPGAAALKRAHSRAAAEELLIDLATHRSREDALEYLQGIQPTRSMLAEAAKIRDVHVQKYDTNAVIMSKLIENVIGAKLDSIAIRGG